jgi:hemerythrin-like domain-containing protein
MAMSTTIDTLGSQHRTVLARLHEIAAAAPAAAPLPDFLAFLQSEVQEHFALEEDFLFPALARHAQLAQGPLAVMEAEHEEFRALVAELAVALRTGNAAAAAGAARDVVGLLRAHIDKEDHVLFPMARHVLSAAELDDLDARAAARRRTSDER